MQRLLQWVGLVAVGLFAAACARAPESPSAMRFGGVGPGLANYVEAGSATYRYAFSGQILDGTTRQPIPEFTVELASQDSAIRSVLNGLGDQRGLFHVSRVVPKTESSFISIPLIISAHGFEPVVQMVDLGSDCDSDGCPGVRPTPFYLQPVAPSVPATKGFSPRSLHEILTSKGVPELFKELMNLGRWDRKTEEILAKAKNSQMIPAALVILKDSPNGAELALSVLSDIEAEDLAQFPVASEIRSVVDIANSRREIATALLASSEILPYLNPLRTRLESQANGKLAGLVGRLLSDRNFHTQLAAIAIKPGTDTGKPDLAMASFLPLIQRWMTQVEASAYAHQNLLHSALQDSATLSFLVTGPRAESNESVRLLLSYLQPLIHAFTSKEGPELILQFNHLLGRDPLGAIMTFPARHAMRERYPKLVPYLEPISRGLKGSDGRALAALLLPILKRDNPGIVIRNIIVRLDSLDAERRCQVVKVLFPGAAHWAQYTVPAKQLFASQIVSGVFLGEFKEMRVAQDLQASPAVVVSGTARDLLKLSLLPNVERVVILK